MKSSNKSETILVYGASLGTAFGAAFGTIFKGIGIPFGISIGIILGITIALLFGRKIVQFFGNPEQKDSDEEIE